MKNIKRSLVSRVGEVFLSSILGLMSFGGLAVKTKDTSNEQVTNSVSASENDKQSAHFYKIKNGKC